MGLTIAFLGDTLLGDLSTGLLRERGYTHAFEGIAQLPLIDVENGRTSRRPTLVQVEAALCLDLPHG